MANKVALNALFDATVTSAKFYTKITGTIRRNDGDQTNFLTTFPHGLGNDQLFVVGWVKSTNGQYPDEVYYFSLPYVDAMGDTIAQATWDTTNVYFEWPWDGSMSGISGDFTQLEYTLLVLIA